MGALLCEITSTSLVLTPQAKHQLMCILFMTQCLLLSLLEMLKTKARSHDRASILTDKDPNPNYGRRTGFENCMEVPGV